ncbi:MAG: Clp protease N-terminal domain-containing protein, partial [Clostridia bacterium]|nr:Clp protease N-terminal domain-containing protein [Clostridia bacterium]
MHFLSMATENLRLAFELAGQTATDVVGTDFIGSEHFIHAFLSLPECEACKILLSSGVSKQKYEQIFRSNVDTKYTGVGLTPNTKKMYDRAVEAATDEGVKAGTALLLYEILFGPTCRSARFFATMCSFADIRAKTFA